MKFLLIGLFIVAIYANADEREDKRVLKDNLSSILLKLKDERNKNFILLDKVEILENKIKRLENQIQVLKKSNSKIDTATTSKKEKLDNSLINQRNDKNEFPKLQMKESCLRDL